ncbi:MAG: DUF1566 domain-containing protein [Deltaproteobacteria bacterium]|nr:DUF1566 domain-containing protein [Deltaproteobacteria bacterium]
MRRPNRKGVLKVAVFLIAGLLMCASCDDGEKTVDKATGSENIKQRPAMEKDVGKTDDQQAYQYHEIARNGAYVAYEDGIVRDTATDLEWVAGPDKDTNWEEAKWWVNGLKIGGGGWRMPTMDELESLHIQGTGERNMTPLLKTTGWWIWSSETEGPKKVWYFDFYSRIRDWTTGDFSNTARAFAVRPRSE